jgi:hypothetical protein
MNPKLLSEEYSAIKSLGKDLKIFKCELQASLRKTVESYTWFIKVLATID